MEYLWNDLYRHAEEVPSPAWHGEVLADASGRLPKVVRCSAIGRPRKPESAINAEKSSRR